jgi:crotonobetainyl-CoA:carnitine CoA-transferase CaiB-like acyl-CoA transferase
MKGPATMSQSLFKGLRVIDAASFVAAPAAATLLADFGADVIKIEPIEGDAYRSTYLLAKPPVPEHNHYWMLGSRNKRSLALDLKAQEGQEIFNRLLDTADVYITNLPFSVRKRLKAGYGDVSRGRPRLIYASFSAYGETGAEAEKPGFDATTYWARSGLMDLMRLNEEAEPLQPVGGLGDCPCGMNLYAAIVSALYRREQTGLGGQVDASLLAGGLWANSLTIQADLCGNTLPSRNPRELARSALNNTYRCGDGRWLNIMILNEDRLVAPFLKALDREDLARDERFASRERRRENSQELIAIFDREFVKRDMAAWRERLDAANVAFEAITTVADISHDSQMWTIGALVPYGGNPALLTINSPFNVDGIEKVPAGAAPDLGQHTEAVLADVGYSAEEIEHLLASRVIAKHDSAKAPK